MKRNVQNPNQMAEAKKQQLGRYAGCLAMTDEKLVLMGRRAFGARRITNVGGGTVEEKDKDDLVAAAKREFDEETFYSVTIEINEPCQVYERVGTQVHSRLFEARLVGKIDVEKLNATAAEHLTELEKLKSNPKTSPQELEYCKRFTEFDAIHLVPLEKLQTAARVYYDMSFKGTKQAEPVHLGGVGTLEPSFCCLLSNPLPMSVA